MKNNIIRHTYEQTWQVHGYGLLSMDLGVAMPFRTVKKKLCSFVDKNWLLTLYALALIVWVFLAVDRNSHSVSDTLIGVFPWAWIFLVTLHWIASHTSSDTSTHD